jgi:hypothetical protein
MSLSALTGATARYEGAGYAEQVVVLTCKSHDSANLAIGHLEIKTGFRHRPELGGPFLIWHMIEQFSTA